MGWDTGPGHQREGARSWRKRKYPSVQSRKAAAIAIRSNLRPSLMGTFLIQALILTADLDPVVTAHELPPHLTYSLPLPWIVDQRSDHLGEVIQRGDNNLASRFNRNPLGAFGCR